MNQLVFKPTNWSIARVERAGKRNKIMNRSRILRSIWLRPLISRVEIARQLGLDKSTVSTIVAELVDFGVVQEVAQGDASSQGGRRPVLLRTNNRYGNVLGLELQPDYYRAVLCDLEGGILGSISEEVEREGRPFDEYVFDIVRRVDSALHLHQRPLLGIGMGMGGLIDCANGIIHGSIPMEIAEEYDFSRQIARRLSVPAYAENDANACAWGELTFHRSRNIRDFVYVLVQIRRSGFGRHLYGGIGVGVGVVLNGTLYSGHASMAGEFRSVYWNEHSEGQFTLTDDEAARVGSDPEVRERLFSEIARNMALVVNVLNLDHVFFGGDVMAYADDFKAILHKEINRNWPYESEVSYNLQPSTFGENAVAYGAAGMLLDRLFTDQIFPLGDTRNRPAHVEMVDQLNEAMIQLGGE